jgi:kynurenine/2-aminoadipate aminotransferase
MRCATRASAAAGKAAVSASPLRFLSRRGGRLQPSAIRELQPLLEIPNMLSLGGGMPAPALFPLSHVALRLKPGSVGAATRNDTNTSELQQEREDMLAVDLSPADVAAAQQYANSYGQPELVGWCEAMLARSHALSEIGSFRAPDAAPSVDSRQGPGPGEGADDVSAVERSVLLTHGSQDGLFKALDVLADEGDSILCENPSYSGALAAMSACGLRPVGVRSDAAGLDVDALRETLEAWDFAKNPLRLLYVIPHGQNPSGSTLSLERRREVYALARRFDLLILEDDPYYFVQLPETQSKTTAERAAGADGSSSTGTPLPSFLSMDSDGRVLRFDSFSKVVCSGLRVGIVSGPAALVEKLQLHQQCSAMQVSGIAQATLMSILRKWGDEGWERQVSRVQDHYGSQRDIALDAADRYLRQPGLADFWVPSAGMFLWMRVSDACGVRDTNGLVKEKAVDAKVLLVPGQSFTPASYLPGRSPAQSPYVRASYSTATPDVLDEAFKRFGMLLQAERDASGA